MPHRIFLAINLPSNIKKQLVKIQNQSENLFSLTDNEFSSPVRWTNEDNLHITLFFIGFTREEEIPEICKITEKVVSANDSFSVELKQVCYAPPGKMPPRMVWALGEKSEALGKIQQELENALLSSPYKKAVEHREYRPHITLGRIKAWEFKKIDPEQRPDIKQDISLIFDVNSVEIMESKLKKSGAEYAVLQSYNLNNS